MFVAMVAIVPVKWLAFLRVGRTVAIEEATLNGQKKDKNNESKII